MLRRDCFDWQAGGSESGVQEIEKVSWVRFPLILKDRTYESSNIPISY